MPEDNPSNNEKNQSSDEEQSEHAVEEANIVEDEDNTTFKDLVSRLHRIQFNFLLIPTGYLLHCRYLLTT